MSNNEEVNNTAQRALAQSSQVTEDQEYLQDLPQASTSLENSQAQVEVLSKLVNTLVESMSANRNQRDPLPRLSKDGEKVHPRDFRPSHYESCPTATHERVLWLENINLDLKLNQAGISIKWHDVDKSLLCRADYDAIETAPTMHTFSEIDITVPYSAIFSSSQESCLVSIVDNRNTNCLVPIPTRIWKALSAQVFGLLKPRIGNSLRSFYQTVSNFDGHALICKLRCEIGNGITKSPLECLEERAALITLSGLSEWPSVRGDLMQLMADWEQAVKDSAVLPCLFKI